MKKVSRATNVSNERMAQTEHLHAVHDAAEVLDLSTEDEVPELGVGKEDDEEHDGEATDVFGTT